LITIGDSAPEYCYKLGLGTDKLPVLNMKNWASEDYFGHEFVASDIAPEWTMASDVFVVDRVIKNLPLVRVHGVGVGVGVGVGHDRTNLRIVCLCAKVLGSQSRLRSCGIFFGSSIVRVM
jgi:hypothetical protein